MGRSGALGLQSTRGQRRAGMGVRVVTVLLLMFGVVSCADKRPAPIEDRSRPGSLRADERYTVLRGDTLYAIAFRYGLDFRRLAAANRIASPYTIFPGQELRLREADVPSRPRSEPAPVSKGSEPARVASASTKNTATTTTTTKPAATKPVAASEASSGTAAKTPPSSESGAGPAADSDVAVARWRWPADGPVVRRFDGTLNKGIDIGGERGDDVAATAGGRVVYAGSGIAGYGLLAIVRHNNEYLSAYGHNDSLLVAEGDVVRPGQVIARRGSSGTDVVKLHFEIRRRGRPVDPLTRLPAR